MSLSVVILNATAGKRMRSLGSRALLTLRGETLLGRQLRQLREAAPGCRVVVVTGFDGDKVARSHPGVEVAVNAEHEETGVVGSLARGLARCGGSDRVLLLYGDMLFGNGLLPAVVGLTHSAVLVGPPGSRAGEVGVAVCGGLATNFAYGLAAKWAHVALLCGAELEAARKVADCRRHRRHTGFELLNAVLELGGAFAVVTVPPDCELEEIDTREDLARVRGKSTGQTCGV